ncbi:MAG: type II toxin-antitoxin system RatA family toxin [Betaproteobacteria bacterium]
MEVRRSALVGFPAETMFDLIEAAERYPDFLPWCTAATVLERDDQVVVAEIGVNFRSVRLDFTTRNSKRRPEFMAITLERGPFRRFDGDWHLTPLGPDGCKIEFALRYDFDSRVVSRIVGPVFERIANTLVDAFVARAGDLRASADRGGKTAVPGGTADPA